MNNYFNSGNPSYPSYPGSDNRAPYPGNDYRAPYPGNANSSGFPIGFEGLSGSNYPSYPPTSASPYPPTPFGSFNYAPSNNSSYQSNFSGGGFPIAPSNPSYNNYPPSQQSFYPSNNPPTSNPSYPSSNYSQSYPNVPPPPTYNPPVQNTYPEYQSQPYQPSNSGSNLFPTLGQNNYTQAQVQPPVSVWNPTLRPFQPFNPVHDAEQLYKAMKGFGTDETKLIDVLCKRTYAQREEISLVFKTSYGKDLIKNIESETSGDFRTLLVTLLTKPMAIEAKHLKESVQGFGTDESALIDVVCTKTNAEMKELKQIYMQIYRKNLEEDVKDDVSGYFKRFLVSLMAGHRSEAPPDYQKAAQQAKELYQAGENRMGTNEVAFNRIICLESHAQLRLVFDEYQKLTGHSIEQAIRSEMSASVQRAFLTVIAIIRKPASYYAQRLHDSMQGVGTKDKLLIRLVVLRSEIDMMDIKNEFQRMYKKSLESWIKSDCSGDYKKALLCLIGDPNWR